MTKTITYLKNAKKLAQWYAEELKKGANEDFLYFRRESIKKQGFRYAMQTRSQKMGEKEFNVYLADLKRFNEIQHKNFMDKINLDREYLENL